MKSNYMFLAFLTMFLSSCSGDNKVTQSNEYKSITYHNLKDNFTDSLYYQTDKALISNMEILLSGKMQGSGVLEIENGSGRFSKIKLKGNINEIYKTEWYQNKCHIKYISQEFVEGDSLILRYRIW